MPDWRESKSSASRVRPEEQDQQEVLDLTEKDAKEDLKKKLTPLQFHVTQQCGTEPPFNNQFWNNKKPGIYVDVVSGEPLFSLK